MWLLISICAGVAALTLLCVLAYCKYLSSVTLRTITFTLYLKYVSFIAGMFSKRKQHNMSSHAQSGVVSIEGKQLFISCSHLHDCCANKYFYWLTSKRFEVA